MCVTIYKHPLGLERTASAIVYFKVQYKYKQNSKLHLGSGFSCLFLINLAQVPDDHFLAFLSPTAFSLAEKEGVGFTV